MNPQQIGKSPFASFVSTLALLLYLISSASALPYGAAVIARQISPTVWSYAIYNTSASKDWWLRDLLFESGPVDATVPDGWEANWSGKEGTWMNSSPNGEPVPNSYVTSEVGIAPGQMQDGFEFDYGCPLNDTSYITCMWWATFYRPGEGAECTGYVGLDTQSVPEPSTAASLGAVMLSFLGLSVRARVRRYS